MENKTTPASNNYYSNLNKLVRFFTQTGSGYAFVSIDDQRYINAINNQLKELLTGNSVTLSVFNFNLENGISFIEQLKKEISGSGRSAIVVSNLWALAQMEGEILTDKGVNYIQQLNFAREELVNLNIPVLIWTSSRVLSIIANRAADLYSQRSINTIHFDEYPENDFHELSLDERFLPEYRDTPDYEALDLKIKLLKKQLSDAESNNYPKPDIANNIALPLAKTFSETDLHPEAAALLEKYDRYFDKNNVKVILYLADICFNSKQYDNAIIGYEHAIEVSQKIKDLHSLSTSYFMLGEIFRELGNIEKALDFFDSLNKLWKEFYDTNPLNESLKNGLAVSYSKLGEIYQSLGEIDIALELCTKVNNLFKELFEASPKSVSIKNGLSISYERLGEIHQSIGEVDNALEFFNYSYNLRKEIFDSNPNSERMKNGLAISLEKLGEVYQSLGQMDKALEFFTNYSNLVKELFDANPKSENLKNGMAVSYSKLGEIYHSLGQFDKAIEYFINYYNLSKELCNTNPNSIDLLEGLAISYYKLAKVYKEKKDNKNGKAYFKEFKRISSNLIAKFPQIPKYKKWSKIKY